MFEISIIGTAFAVLGGLFAVTILAAIFFRTVVSTNDVHIVQSSSKTTSYGKGEDAGNTYYSWPAWLPIIGIEVIELPVSVFSRGLDSYAAYDKDRVPFVIDIIAFFRITDSNTAAQRVKTVDELKLQLDAILQGAARSILAQSEIDEILEGRGKFGEEFTKAVDDQLKEWGVQTVKGIELMDIRDASDSQVIHNIMAKKKSHIEMESRVEVAKNLKTAQVSEIEAKREVDVQAQDAEKLVGERTATKVKDVGIANEKAQQEIKEQAKITAEKDMAVNLVNDVRAAEIKKEVQVVEAQQQKETDVIKADGQKQQTVLIAEGDLESKKRESTGIELEGSARASAERLMQTAPVEAQILLAQEIGENSGYQEYLVSVRAIEANQVVGVEQAQALQKADVKVISNAGEPVAGVNKVMDLFSSNGGTNIAAMLEGIGQTEVGKNLLDKFAPEFKYVDDNSSKE